MIKNKNSFFKVTLTVRDLTVENDPTSEYTKEQEDADRSRSWFDFIDLYFELSGTNMLLKKQIIHIIYNELTASGKLGSSNVNNMFCALEY